MQIMVNIHYPIVAAINATAQTFVLGFAGVLLSWFKVSTRQVFDTTGADSLGKLTMMLFLPALMFTTLIDDISDSDINTLFEVLLYTTSRSLNSACGYWTHYWDSLWVCAEGEA